MKQGTHRHACMVSIPKVLKRICWACQIAASPLFSVSTQMSAGLSSCLGTVRHTHMPVG